MLKGLNITVTRSKRKTLSLTIHPDQSIRVSAPLRLPDAKIEDFITSKIKWISRKLKTFENVKKISAPLFSEGGIFPVLARQYKLTVIHTPTPYVTLFEDQIVVSVRTGLEPARQAKAVQKQLIQWYQEHALIRAKERCNFYSGLLKVSPRSISVKRYSRRWGVCKSTREITFNWLLVFGPPELFDYVVVHELSHIRVFNHSPAFWHLVGSVCPDYKQSKKQLQEMSYQDLGLILGLS